MKAFQGWKKKNKKKKKRLQPTGLVLEFALGDRLLRVRKQLLLLLTCIHVFGRAVGGIRHSDGHVTAWKRAFDSRLKTFTTISMAKN
jgi:hypothetical protein